MREIDDIVRAFERRPHERFALATLVQAHGSSYRRPGARMLIAPDGNAAGSLSAGCLEEEVVECHSHGSSGVDAVRHAPRLRLSRCD
jgi:xanthine dehydrogenase accessory factor